LTPTQNQIPKDLTKRECKISFGGIKGRGGSPSGLDCEDPAQPIAERQRDERKRRGLLVSEM